MAFCLQVSPVKAHSAEEVQADRTEVIHQIPKESSKSYEKKSIDTTYVLGPGDSLFIEVLDLPELSGNFAIGPDGSLYLPRLRSLYVEGLTLEELHSVLVKSFSTFVLEPQIHIQPVVYRPIRIFIGGEIKKPGYYELRCVRTASEKIASTSSISGDLSSQDIFKIPIQNSISGSFNQGPSCSTVFPTVYNAIGLAEGITPYTDLTKVKLTRKRPEILGGGRIQANLNIFSVIKGVDQSQNIRLFDGDVITIGKSPVVLREQLIAAGQSNLNPDLIKVFVTGRVNIPGAVEIPHGSSLNQALMVSGGAKLLKGRVEFVRFKRDGTIDRRLFPYSPNATFDSHRNPVLASGDVIRVRDSLLSGSVSVMNEITSPFTGFFTVYSLINSINR